MIWKGSGDIPYSASSRQTRPRCTYYSNSSTLEGVACLLRGRGVDVLLLWVPTTTGTWRLIQICLNSTPFNHRVSTYSVKSNRLFSLHFGIFLIFINFYQFENLEDWSSICAILFFGLPRGNSNIFVPEYAEYDGHQFLSRYVRKTLFQKHTTTTHQIKNISEGNFVEIHRVNLVDIFLEHAIFQVLKKFRFLRLTDGLEEKFLLQEELGGCFVALLVNKQ